MNNIFQQYKGAMVLVIGGAGFIGSNLVRHLVDLGAKVTVVDSLFPNYGGNLFNLLGYQDKISFIQKDICNLALAYQVVKNQDFIFNLAGQTSHLDSMHDPFTDQKNNVTARLTIMEACRHKNPQCRIIYTSTRQIYGRPQYLPVDESHPLSPVDFNGVSEIASEHYHNLYHSIFNLPITILRLTNVIGPRMRIKDARQNFVGSWIRKLIEGDEILVYGDGSQYRDLLIVDNVVDALLRSGITPSSIGEVMNLGSCHVSLLELAEMMVEIAGKGSFKTIPFPPNRKAIDIGSYYSDYTKAAKILGWHADENLGAGLRLTLHFFFENYQHYL